MQRVLVTGARAWTDAAAVCRSLDLVLAHLGSFILIQGDAKDGLDVIAKGWAIRTNCPHEDVPADWSRSCDGDCHHSVRWRNGTTYCTIAGFLRNQEMVDRGADLCLAWPLGKSLGTRDCMRRAKRAGIPVINLGEE